MSTHIASRHPILRLVPVIALFLASAWAQADEPANFLASRLLVADAEIELIKAELEYATWKQGQLDELHRDGFATWLETRRHQVKVDSLAVRLRSAREFQQFLSAIADQYDSSNVAVDSVYQPRVSKPVKVYLPDSVRIVGWIEGQPLVETAEPPSNNQEIKSAKDKLARAKKRFEIVGDLPTASAAVQENARLKLNLAQQQLKHLEASQEFQLSSAATGTASITLDEIDHVVTANADASLMAAIKRVAKAESAAQGQIKSLKIMLGREHRRAEALADWQNHGHATEIELNVINDRVAELNRHLESHLKKQQSPGVTVSEFEETPISAIDTEYRSVNDWPAEIFADQEFVFHLIDLRRNYCGEKVSAETNRLIAEMLGEVLTRLKLAASKSQAETQLDPALSAGQKNEIKSYETDIEFAQANRLASIERQQVLVLEEHRFSLQAIAMHEAARDRWAGSPQPEFGLIGWTRLLHPTGAIASANSTRKLTHYSYLEWDRLQKRTATSSLLFCQANHQFLGGTFSTTLDRYSLMPADTSLMTSYAGRKLYRPRRLEVEPQWVSYFRKNQSRNVVSTYDFPQLWRNDRCRSTRYSVGDYWAYPNGNLRSELRGRITPGQIPWYLPGSPGNIRSDQIR